MSFADKSALVTGATGGIGGAICEELLKNGVTHLAALDLNSEEPTIVSEWKKTFPGASIKYFQVDVCSHDQLEKCYAEFINEVKSLDIVVNCAGIFDESSYRKTIEVNLCGVIGSTHIAVEHMRKDNNGKGGIICNIASIAGLTPISCAPTYTATKHGVLAFTRAMNHDREYLGIKFFVLCPGGTQSPLFYKVSNPEYFYMTDADKINELKAAHPPQSPSAVGEATIKIMQDAESGSVWVIEQGKLTEIALPAIQF